MTCSFDAPQEHVIIKTSRISLRGFGPLKTRHYSIKSKAANVIYIDTVFIQPDPILNALNVNIDLLSFKL